MLFHRKIVRLTVPVLAGTMLLTGCGGGDDSANGDTLKIAFQGPLSGDNVQLGVNMADGIKLAIEQANAKGDLGFKLEYKAVDDQGLPEKATAAAQKAIDDQSVLAVVGPAFSGATDSASPLYSEAGLVTVSPSATRPDLTTKGYKSLLRAVPNDSSQGKGMAAFFDKKTDAKEVMVVDDKTDYGVGLADVAVKELKARGIKVGPHQRPAEDAGLQRHRAEDRELGCGRSDLRGLLPGRGTFCEEGEGGRLQGRHDVGRRREGRAVRQACG